MSEMSKTTFNGEFHIIIGRLFHTASDLEMLAQSTKDEAQANYARDFAEGIKKVIASFEVPVV